MIFPSIKIYNRFISFFALVLFIAIKSVIAAPGTIADQPLFTSNSAPPLVFLEVDESGSMDSEILTKQYWEARAYRSGSNTNGVLVTDGTHISIGEPGSGTIFFEYIFDNSDDVFQNDACHTNTDSFGTLEECSTVNDYDWRVLSPAVNVMYYDPSITYSPWQKGDNTAMAPGVFSAARSDPQSGKSGVNGYNDVRNLAGFVYHVWSDTHGYTGARPTSGTINKTTTPNQEVDWWDDHRRFTVNATSITVDDITTGPTGNTETTTLFTTLTGTMPQALLNGRTIAEEQLNLANWYQYARRRAFVAKSALAKVITDNPDFRYGLNFINNHSFPYKTGTTSFVQAPAIKGSTTENTALISGLFDLDWPSGGTGLRRGLERAGAYMDNTDGRTDPITEECQQNFTILFTDGFWNGSAPAFAIGDSDGDGRNRTVSDVANFYYDQDLSPLGTAGDDDEFQRMTTYTVAFGVTGQLIDTDGDGWPGIFPGLAKNGNWGDPFNSEPEKIDDLWHAAFNADGKFLSADTPAGVAQALSDALEDITDTIGTAASVAFNTSTLTGSSSIFLAQFNSTNNQWTGDIISFPLDPVTGELITMVDPTDPTKTIPVTNWSAADKLDARVAAGTARNIFTYHPSAFEGRPFQWNKLKGNPQRRDLRTNPDSTLENTSGRPKAKARLAYLRGVRTNEESNNGTYTFRDRAKILADIVDSTPVFIGMPGLPWPDLAPFPDVVGTNTYSDFKNGAAKTRTPMLYVGANDGMLHAFNATTGEEEFAYIPNFLFSSGTITGGLHFLTDPNYSHRFYVDMPIAISDAYFDNSSGTDAWHTVLIGGGRAGGRGLFALEITDPTKFVENDGNADDLVLWEFDSTDDADLGQTFSTPVIAFLNNGRWAAIFGNGYNGTGDGEAKLFILFLDGGLDGVWTPGTDYIEISTQVGLISNGDCADGSSQCNGLSTPQAVDLNGDKVVDRIYAGDLAGNMWPFDLSDPDPSNWEIAYGTVAAPLPLFTATHHNGNPPTQQSATPQPITSKPILVRHPDGLGGDPDVLVFFGTGQYLNTSDVSNSSVQTFYGVWDNGTPSLTPADLIEQTFITDVFNNAGVDVSSEIRVTTDNTVNYTGADNGWFLNLTASSGERIIVDPDVRGGLVFFNTWIPDTNVCNAGGSGVLMSVKQSNGGRPDQAAFDLNGDGIVDVNDLVTVLDASGNVIGTYAPSGEVFNLGLPASSNFLSNKQYTPGTESLVPDIREVEPLNDSGTGRLSWQELRP